MSNFSIETELKKIEGEKFFEKWCLEHGFTFEKSNVDEDRSGYDYKVFDGTGQMWFVDVKCSNHLYIGRINKNGTFTTRHPFRKDTQATHLFVIKDGIILSKGIEPVQEYLLNFFPSRINLERLKTILAKFNNTHFATHKLKKCESFAMFIKTDIKYLPAENCIIAYDPYNIKDTYTKKNHTEYGFYIETKNDYKQHRKNSLPRTN